MLVDTSSWLKGLIVMRKSQERKAHEEELKYILRTDPRSPGGLFNNDTSVFQGYVKMQANFARLDGYADIYEAMLTHTSK